jgi:hypothetical protein
MKVSHFTSASVLVVVVVAASLNLTATSGATGFANSDSSLLQPLLSYSTSSGHSYALSLFAKIPMPSSAVRLESPIQPLHPVSGIPGMAQTVAIARYYIVPASFGVEAWSKSRFPQSQWEGTAGTSDGGYHFSDSFSAMSYCPDRHASFCGVTYSAEALGGNRQELRIDVVVVWLPIHEVILPTAGVVTVTGYDKISLMNSSSGPVRIRLNTSQVKKLRQAIELLRSAPGGLCMEDSTLYKISVGSKAGGKVIWSAIADECPGELVVTSNGSRIDLNARSCPLDVLVATFFPAREAQGTKSGLKVCQPSY